MKIVCSLSSIVKLLILDALLGFSAGVWVSLDERGLGGWAPHPTCLESPHSRLRMLDGQPCAEATNRIPNLSSR
jgi:hypothetical protein